MRLQYARLKVEHGWVSFFLLFKHFFTFTFLVLKQKQSLNEVENLYFHHHGVRDTSRTDPFPPKNLPLTISKETALTGDNGSNDQQSQGSLIDDINHSAALEQEDEQTTLAPVAENIAPPNDPAVSNDHVHVEGGSSQPDIEPQRKTSDFNISRESDDRASQLLTSPSPFTNLPSRSSSETNIAEHKRLDHSFFLSPASFPTASHKLQLITPDTEQRSASRSASLQSVSPFSSQ